MKISSFDDLAAMVSGKVETTGFSNRGEILEV
jgi:hypothetical protein